MKSIKRRTFLKLATGLGIYLPLSPGRLFASRNSFVRRVPKTAFNAPDGSWTLAVLPDTQYYSRSYPEVFIRQTEWIVDHKKSHNILFVAHEGDIVQNNIASQWHNASRAMNILNRSKVPYALLPGNHDMGRRGRCDTRDTLLNNYFYEEDYENSVRYELFKSGEMENSWHEILTPTGKFLLLALEFGPRDEVLEWANEVCARHPDHKVIVVTHSYIDAHNRMSPSALNYGFVEHGSVNDGVELYNKLISLQPNIILTLNGHHTGIGTGMLTATGRARQTIHQILANYQDSGRGEGGGGVVNPPRGYGGGGYLRLMRFLPDKRTVDVKTYSPWFDHWDEAPNQSFTLRL